MEFSSYLAIIIIESLVVAIVLYLYVKNTAIQRELEARELEMSRRMYELSILKEIGDRISYSLNIAQIADVITGSLKQLIDYSAVSYMLLEPEKIIFKIHLEKSVHRQFVDEIAERMIHSLSALLEADVKKTRIEEVITGAILIENFKEKLGSFFNIPLVIGDRVVGIMTVAHTKAGLYREEEMTVLYKLIKQASTAVTRLQEVIKVEEQKINAMVESMSEGVLMTDREYRLIVANPASRRAAGIVKDDPTIFDYMERLAGTFDLRGKLDEVIKLDRQIDIPEIFLNDRFYQILVSTVKGDVGIKKNEILGAIILFHDITEQKEIERLREDFTSMMVHELRSPLDGIRKISELVIRRGESIGPEKFIKEYAPIIFKSSSDMLILVNDLLDAAKIEAGKFEVHPEAANVPEIVSERIQFYAASAADAKIELDSKIDPKLPVSIPLDRRGISQVLNNLISNSLKFTREGGKITVGAFAHRSGVAAEAEAKEAGVRLPEGSEKLKNFGDGVVFSVADTGVGISPAALPQLFNKFKQFRQSVMEKKGTGLGLVIAKGIIEAHGGYIGVASEENAGTTFYFAIPLSPKVPDRAGGFGRGRESLRPVL